MTATSPSAPIHRSRHGGLAWRRCGNDAAPTVVLLHPIATDGSVWDGHAAALADRFDVIAIDLPGHGSSDALGGSPSMADYADRVAASLLAGGVARAAFVGLSIGSMIAQRLAANDVGLVEAVVLANGVAWTPDAARLAWRARIDSAEAGGMTALRDAMLQRWFTPEFLAQAPAVTDAIGDLIVATPVRGFVEAAGAIERLDNRALLPGIGCPTLVMAGAYDGAAPADAVEPIAHAISGARYVALPAAHLANIEAADRFDHTVGDFLDTALASAR